MSPTAALYAGTRLIEHLTRHVAARIRARRRAVGLTTAELALIMDTTAEEIEGFERGEELVPVEELLCLSTALGVHVNYFYDDEPEPIRH